MRKHKGFTFVELMLVLLVLGVIIMLTIPLLSNLKDDDKIYRAYMKKANQDVTDAVSMALIKNRLFTGFDKLGSISGGTGTADYRANSSGIRTALEVAIAGKECTGYSNSANVEPCVDNSNKLVISESKTLTNDTPGLILSGKSVMMFEYAYEDATTTKEATYGFIYIDMNGNKSPNELCKDRYQFELYKDRAVMVGCDLSL